MAVLARGVMKQQPVVLLVGSGLPIPRWLDKMSAYAQGVYRIVGPSDLCSDCCRFPGEGGSWYLGRYKGVAVPVPRTGTRRKPGGSREALGASGSSRERKQANFDFDGHAFIIRGSLAKPLSNCTLESTLVACEEISPPTGHVSVVVDT